MSSTSASSFAVLGLLSLKPMSGYDIKLFFERIGSHVWHESFGRIYPSLQELKAEGAIRRHKITPRGKRERITYAITPKGKEKLQNWLATPPRPTWIRNEFLLKFILAKNVSRPVVVGHIQSQKTQLQDQLNRVQSYQKVLAGGADPDMIGSPYSVLVSRLGELATEARLRWCQEALDLLEGKKGRRAP